MAREIIMRTIFTKAFKKEFKKLAGKRRSTFAKRLSLFKSDTSSNILNNHKLTGKYAGYRSINITGDIRVIFYENDDICIFVRIGTHSELYEQKTGL